MTVSATATAIPQVVNWVRSRSPDKLSFMRYAGEWKFPGGSSRRRTVIVMTPPLHPY